MPGCLGSVAVAAPPVPEVWLVDNASTDDTVRWVRENHPYVRILANARNMGFAAGINRGIRASLAEGADYVVLLNQDMTVEPGWMQALHEAVSKGGPGIYGALELTYGGAGFDPASLRNWCEQAPRFVDDLLFGRLQRAYPSNIAFGGCVAIHRSVFQQIGFLDEAFFMYCEDIDFSRRARRAGITISLLPFCRVRHHSSMSSERGYENPRIARWNRRGWIILQLKNPGKPFVRSLISELASQSRKVIRNAVRLRRGDTRECTEDIVWLLANARAILSSRRRDMVT